MSDAEMAEKDATIATLQTQVRDWTRVADEVQKARNDIQGKLFKAQDDLARVGGVLDEWEEANIHRRPAAQLRWALRRETPPHD